MSTAPLIKVLLIEDDAGDASLIRHHLKMAQRVDFQVHWVQSMQQAIERLKAGELRFDIILLDLSLPDSHGLESVRSARAAAAEIPIIVLTGNDDESFALEAIEAGAEDYLVKGGFESEMLVRAIRYASQRAHMEARIGLLAAAVEVAAEAVMITEPDASIRVVNPAFSEITGYTEAEVVGKLPSMLKSGRHDAGFYKRMWQTLLQTGTWQGELINQRKNGEHYPQWLSIRAVRDEAGTVLNYVAVATDLSLVRQAEAELERANYTDALTGLGNRGYLLEQLEIALVRARRSHEHGAVVIIDVERFRAINEAQGMEMGDALLHELGQRMRGYLHPDDCIARLGGDQFAFIALHLSAKRQEAARDTMAMLSRLQKELERELEVAGRSYRLKLRFGVSLFPDLNRESASDHLRNAITALSRIKRESFERISFFELAMGERARERYRLENELRHGIESNELRLYLQPQLSMAEGIIGFESLVRWQHPERGLVPPNDFIPVAEESGLIVELDRWVLETACALLPQLMAVGYNGSMSVNISPRFFAHAEFVTMVRIALNAAGADPGMLILEVTERLFIADIIESAEKMHALAELGVRFSIDDFGTGYSSLAYLKRLPVNELKIDRSFVRDLPDDHDNVVLVETIVSVARHLGLSIVAEGVETQEQSDFLQGCGEVIQQGFLHGRPEPAENWIGGKTGSSV